VRVVSSADGIVDDVFKVLWKDVVPLYATNRDFGYLGYEGKTLTKSIRQV